MLPTPSGWLDKSQWDLVKTWVPIPCVDVLILNAPALNAPISHVGLILRDTPHQGRRWCLVGGRVLLYQTFDQAIVHQVKTTLGRAAEPIIPPDPHPVHIAQYFPTPRDDHFVDPRQHSIALTFTIPIIGSILAQGEALSFQWFLPSNVPPPDQFGFGHDRVVAACISYLAAQGRLAP